MGSDKDDKIKAPRTDETEEFFADGPEGATGRFMAIPNMSVANALTHLTQERFDEAEAALREALDKDKYNGDVWAWLLVVQARRLIKAGDQAGAVEKYREILEIAPHHQEAALAVADFDLAGPGRLGKRVPKR